MSFYTRLTGMEENMTTITGGDLGKGLLSWSWLVEI